MEFDHWLLNLYHHARELPIGAFQTYALKALKEVLSFDSGMWGDGAYSEFDGLMLSSVYLHNQPVEMLRSYESVCAHDPALHLSAQNTSTAQAFTAASQLSPRNYAKLREHTRRYEMEQALVLLHTNRRTQDSDIVSLWRRHPDRPYTQSDEVLGTRLINHLIEAGSINRMLWLPKDESLSTGTAVATLGGAVLAHDPGYCTCIHAEWPGQKTAWLPPLLMDSLKNTLESRYIGKRITIHGEVKDNVLVLHASQNSTTSRITKAQQNVASLLVRGLSYKEIAKELGVSPATVRNHVHAVYKKLGVRNKVELAQNLHNSGLR